ncbi:translesion error-prone DNA polymerase V autoproteolytic subunit [Lentisphaera profundi]|uniref:Translesion error-prone DNA polymerase V autoproteolytic subunit n=1 Tax=Lentisphaera profundi TaxID=1658616 RepID=A0ABY7VU49_9BACT|nr:translesion error-prone DNA polymerase V autoproteolytic subunit [Lentisphaera profundi]WDE96745.1 translesion error-prone DNA polymerase V autoproteolytic subunit [Lentisphaera profundi]
MKQFCPLLFQPVSAGFPSPADDFIEMQLNIHDYLVKHPAASFFLRVAGDSMNGAGIFTGDILVVDRSLQASNLDLVIALVEGYFTVKQLQRNKQGQYRLLAANPSYPPIECEELEIWGVVTGVVRKYK